MDEVKRFMRYTLPGIVCSIELALAMIITYPVMANNLLNFMKESNGIGAAIGFLLTSGALGYLFSVIYYIIWNKRKLFYDHTPALLVLEKEFCIRFQNVERMFAKKGEGTKKYECKPADLCKLSLKDKWEIFHAMWHRRRGQSEELKANDERTERLLDILHGHGVTCVGSSIAFIVWILYVVTSYSWSYTWFLFNWLKLGFILICWLGLIITVGWIYSLTKKTVNNILNMALINNFETEEASSNKVFYISKIDDFKRLCS